MTPSPTDPRAPEPTGERSDLRDALRRIVDAKRAVDSDALNAALKDVNRLARGYFERLVERRLAASDREGGIERRIDDACDVLNEILWLVCQKAETFRGATDFEARAWLKRIVERKLIDKGRARARRSAKWREILRLVPKRLAGLLEN